MSSNQEVYPAIRPICFWTASDVDDWLRKRKPKLALKYSLFFLRHNISGRVLVDITDEDLEEIGIASYDERQEILLEVKNEKLYSDLDELTKLRG
ncbi:unnamed protein product [Auanema sp. JU1783]|nr:unnamed protein product [Auanema sp. JU1783]